MHPKSTFARIFHSFFLICLIILCQTSLFAQSSPEFEKAYENLIKNKDIDSETFTIRAESFLKKYQFQTSSVQQAKIFTSLARISLSMGKPVECLAHLEKAIAVLDPTVDEEKSAYSNCLLIKSQCLSSMDDYSTAKKTLNHLLSVLGNDPKTKSNATANLGTIALLEGNLSLARAYILEAIRLGTESHGPGHPMIANCYNNLAGIEMALGNDEKEVAYLLKCIEIKEKALGPDSPALTINLMNLAETINNQGNVQEAISFTKRAESILRSNFTVANSELRLLLVNLASYYAQTKETTTALACLIEAQEIQAQHFDPKDSRSSSFYIYAASAYVDLGMPEKAKSLLHLAALNIAIPEYGPIAFEEAKQPENIPNFLTCQQFYFELMAKSNPKYLDSLEQSYFQSIAFLEYELLAPRENSDRSLSTEASYQVYESLINLLFRRDSLGNASKIFALMEGSKSRILRENVLNSRAESFSKLPDSLREKTLFLDEKLLELQTQGFENAQELGHVPLKAYHAEVLFYREEKRKLIQLFKTDFPAYYQLRYASELSTLSEIQLSLPKETAILEYFEGDTSIFIFCIQADAQRLVRLPKTDAFKQLILNFRKGMAGFSAASDRDPRNYEMLSKLYTDAAFELYLKLLASFGDSLPLKLVVIPDGFLYYIPFDALLSKRPSDPTDFRSHSYLLRDYQISYQNSATLWAKSSEKRKSNKKTKGVLAIAPQFEASSNLHAGIVSRSLPLLPLAHNVEEAEGIQEIWKGELLVGKAANRSDFQKLANQFEIIHLATHARSNDEDGDFSFVAFSALETSLAGNGGNDSSRLYAQALYALELDAEIVVLSACETGLGELRRGEGMLSLSRGFIYAGVKSTVTSLWAINDARSKDLMLNFHRFLKKGNDKDAALRLAKLHYLENSDNPHPYYWAAFVAFGDMKPIGNQSQGIFWLLAIALILLTIIHLSHQQSRF